MLQSMQDFFFILHQQSLHDWPLKLTLLISAFIFGACLGSFMQASIYRIPKGICLSYPGSQCPKCQHKLTWHENFPVFGWIWLRGKCKNCKDSISPEYMIGEALFGILSLLLFHYFFFEKMNIFAWIQSLMVCFWLYTISRIDIEKKIIPDALSLFPLIMMVYSDIFFFNQNTSFHFSKLSFIPFLFAIIFSNYFYKGLSKTVWLLLGDLAYLKAVKALARCNMVDEENASLKPMGWAIFTFFHVCIFIVFNFDVSLEPFRNAALGFFLALTLLYTVRWIGKLISKQEALGLGDIKLTVTLGYLLGPYNLLICLCFAALLGTLFGCAHLIKKGKQQIPFGPFIALGALIAFKWPLICQALNLPLVF